MQCIIRNNNNNNIIILFISYITVQQQDEVCKRNTQNVQSCSGQQFNYMVVKYITMSLASHCCIVPHVIVLSLILMHSAIILACMASSVLMVFFVAFGDELANSDI